MRNFDFGKIQKFLMMGIALLFPVASFSQELELRDPTEPQFATEIKVQGPSQQPYELTEILISNGKSLAVINGKFFKVGDKLGNRFNSQF